MVQKMKYTARLGINCGISSGYGIKYPDYVEIEEQFAADTFVDAVIQASKLATRFADNYLSDPETDYTTVRLLSFFEEKRELKLDNEMVVRRSTLDHLLNVATEEILDAANMKIVPSNKGSR